ncbi:MAG: alpha/beta hydrolase [Rhodoferax sp.]|nr:alpha/beta hydrolase [Rhodoferax sp.]
MKPANSEPEQLTLRAADGYPLTALRYPTTAPLRGHLVMAGATGVPQLFYRNFALFAASQGYTTLTLDYRGIGLSRQGTLRGFRMRYLQWAHDDLSAAVETMASDTVPLFMIGHSFGGHAFGLLPNHARVARFYTFATGAGWHGWMPKAEQWKVLLMWRIVGPLLTRWKGYLAWSKLGMGEDLPLDVFRDWKHWCRYPRYFFDDPAMAHVHGLFASVTTPIRAANAKDDLWAPPASRDAFMAAYRNADCQTIDIDPRTSGLGAIGHMGYFRRTAQPLWEEALRWFGEHPRPKPKAAARAHHHIAGDALVAA